MCHVSGMPESVSNPWMMDRYAMNFCDMGGNEKIMDGSFFGNIVGVGYWGLFIAAGIWISFRLLSQENLGVRILLGSVIGSFLLQWLPLLCSIPAGFTLASHGVALILLLLLTFAITYFIPNTTEPVAAARTNRSSRKRSKHSGKTDKGGMCLEDRLFLVFSTILFLFFCYLLKTHTIPLEESGAYATGQATYGDMNMHFSFITSIARQGFFPPEYSILPGHRICYPFLCDSISSSIYIWGASLRLAYNLPMLVAFWQVMGGVYLLAAVLFRKWNAILTWILFFFDGGLGVLYFVNIFGEEGTKNFTRIFTEFYQTPTNLVDNNIRWTNIVVDMLLPQRATLFGWAILFPTILVLAIALRRKKLPYIILAGILTGGMPMIHTHSFVAMAFIGAIWLLGSLLQETHANWMNQKPVLERGIFLAGFLLLNFLSFAHISKDTQVNNNLLLGLAFANAAVITICCLWAVYRGWKHVVPVTKKARSRKKATQNEKNSSTENKKFQSLSGGKQTVILWAVFLGLVLLCALPQLFTWTFQQAKGEQFLRGSFNWCNEQEHFLVFYIKNLGLMFLFTVIAIFRVSRKQLWQVGPAFFLWFTSELVIYQPNSYDNNKVLLVAYFFFSMLVSELILEVWDKLQKKRILRGTLLAVCLFVMTISAVLTMGREAVSHYELYPQNEVKMCKYIEDNLEPDTIILTDTRHNNGISSLTGRNIVCGSSSILYYHGLPYQSVEIAVGQMYADPGNRDLMEQYGIDYILVGPSERNSYGINDESAFSSNYKLIHTEGDYNLYQFQP